MSIGEILDRAISTYVRRCLPLFVILAITVVPVSLIQLAATPGFTHMNQLFVQMNHLPPSAFAARNLLIAQMFRSLNFGALFAIFVAGPLVFYPLSRNAILTYTNAALEGVPVSIAAAYRVSFRKWPAQVITAMAYITIELCVMFVILIVGVLTALVLAGAVVLITGSRGSSNLAAGIAVIVLTSVIVIVAAFVFALLNVAFELSSISVALEESRPFRAIGKGWRRTFDRTLLRRNIGVALAYFAVELLGTAALFAAGALLQALAHSDLLQSVVGAIANVLIVGVLAVFMLIYARDVRLRREGSDLLRAANRPSPAP